MRSTMAAAMAPLAGCDGGSEPPVVQVSDGGGGGGVQSQTIEEQLANMQNQIDALRAKAGQ